VLFYLSLNTFIQYQTHFKILHQNDWWVEIYCQINSQTCNNNANSLVNSRDVMMINMSLFLLNVCIWLCFFWEDSSMCAVTWWAACSCLRSSRSWLSKKDHNLKVLHRAFKFVITCTSFVNYVNWSADMKQWTVDQNTELRRTLETWLSSQHVISLKISLHLSLSLLSCLI